MIKGTSPITYLVHNAKAGRPMQGAVIEEEMVCVHVNGHELVTFMCSPVDLKELALGFLRAEELIRGLDEVELVELSSRGTCVDIWLNREFVPPERTIRTSGCSGGITFDDLTAKRKPLPLGRGVDGQQVLDRYRELRATEILYPIARGVHASALCTPEAAVHVAEDVGRHNTLDKLWGKAMLSGIDPAGHLIVTTGRISAEMLGKAAKMQVPIVASRTSPTSRSLALAEAWNITVIGYIRQNAMRVYTVPERISNQIG